MKYVQGGCTLVDGSKTKKALKEAIARKPAAVYLYDTTDTSIRPSAYSGPASELPDDVTFNVVGPDPYTDRSWYASVYWSNGRLVVK